MADVNINGLGGPLASPAADDLIPVWDTSAGQTLKIRRDVFVGATITGGGTLALGGYTLTVPATGTAALRNVSQTFAAAQAITPTATSDNGLEIRMPAATTGKMLQMFYNGVERSYLKASGISEEFILQDFDNGSGAGPYIGVLRNSNASTPAAGSIVLRNRGASDYFLWPDASGNLRIHTAQPTNALDGAGTAVGAQTSHIDYKDVLGGPVDDVAALEFICAAAAHVARFVYRNGAFNGEEFSGVVLDGAQLHRYGMDADTEHLAGKSLNVINAIGDLFLAVRGLAQRVEHLAAAAQK